MYRCITEEERGDLQKDVDEVFENDITLLEKFHIMEKLLEWKKKLDKIAMFTYDKGLKTMMMKFALCYKRGMMRDKSFFVNIEDLPYKTVGLLVSLKKFFLSKDRRVYEMKRQKYNKNKQVLFYYDSFRINVPEVWMHCKIEDLRQETDNSRNSSIVDYDSDFEWWLYYFFATATVEC